MCGGAGGALVCDRLRHHQHHHHGSQTPDLTLTLSSQHLRMSVASLAPSSTRSGAPDGCDAGEWYPGCHHHGRRAEQVWVIT
jgi:hypothetical protein